MGKVTFGDGVYRSQNGVSDSATWHHFFGQLANRLFSPTTKIRFFWLFANFPSCGKISNYFRKIHDLISLAEDVQIPCTEHLATRAIDNSSWNRAAAFSIFDNPSSCVDTRFSNKTSDVGSPFQFLSEEYSSASELLKCRHVGWKLSVREVAATYPVPCKEINSPRPSGAEGKRIRENLIGNRGDPMIFQVCHHLH